jgi:hypothetical protein
MNDAAASIIVLLAAADAISKVYENLHEAPNTVLYVKRSLNFLVLLTCS